MAFRVFGDDRDSHDILAIDSQEKALSSLSRQDDLFRRGNEFEAAIARAALVEGLLLTYLLTAKQLRGKVFDPSTERSLQDQRITFGQVKDALKKSSAFHDSKLADDVEAFVGGRNKVAHQLAVGIEPFDVGGFFASGASIALRLWTHILDETKAHREANL